MATGWTSRVPRSYGDIAARLALAGFFFWAPASFAEEQAHQAPRTDGSKDVEALDHLLPAIRRAHPGDLSDAHGPAYGPSGEPHYHLKWITPEGRVYWLDADARNGQVLRTSPGRDSFDDR